MSIFMWQALKTKKKTVTGKAFVMESYCPLTGTAQAVRSEGEIRDIYIYTHKYVFIDIYSLSYYFLYIHI